MSQNNRTFKRRLCATLASLVFGIALAPAAQAAVVSLGSYNVAPDSTSVSGFSSGGFMAAQVVVALSATFKAGAGIVAGGPFYCVGTGGIASSTGTCATGSPDVNASYSTTTSWSNSGAIDNISNLATSRIYVFHGANDQTIYGSVTTATSDYFKKIVPAANVIYNNGSTQANHGMVTDYYGNGCTIHTAPYIVNCNFDLSGAFLQQIYGALNAKNTGTLGGQYINFNQNEFIPGGSGHGLAGDGWAYVPQNCANGASCKVHFVFHGCKQYASGSQGDTYYKDTGYNRWADTNNIIVVYPQTAASTNPYNYDGCWDYWGYDTADYAKKSAPQIQMVLAIANRLKGGGTTTTTTTVGGTTTTTSATTTTTTAGGICYNASNYAHVSAGRAHLVYTNGHAAANGSNQDMGFDNTFITSKLRMTGTNYYVVDASCP